MFFFFILSHNGDIAASQRQRTLEYLDFVPLQADEFAISLESGAVVLSCRGTRVKSHKKQYNDGKAHFLVASVNGQK